ncbi:hypothetical protein Alsa3_CDS0161 [Staphylococcus phage Alsa_3]|nr:hypothetical protein Alsa3_CDS0161 [Staphylococcus phage Alsa_3]WNM51286.1 hypothetical protein Alsa4_CDS0156 [Staphylococcus phage Alsa_4]
MKKITQKELDKRIELHQEWVRDNSKGEPLDLVNCDLSYLSVADVDLRFADLIDCDLSYVTILNSNLRYANLKGSKLGFADLTNSDLGDAKLHNTDLSYTKLRSTNLSFAYLKESNLAFTDLRHAILSCANLTYCTLDNTRLSESNTNQVYGIDMYSIDNIGTFSGKVTYVPSIDTVYAGCWSGTLEQFLEKGLEMNKGNKQETKNIKLAYQFFKNNSK